MTSPFPGMDPYLEQHWLDVHARLILYACDQLEEQLPGSLIARVEERVVFETEEAAEHWTYPDVRVVEQAPVAPAAVPPRGEAAVIEPVIVRVDPEPATETFIQVRDREAENRLVTVIEILSLANKLPGRGQHEYRRKQQDLRAAHVSLVEIDLLRRGRRVFLVPVSRIPPRARTPYQACVWRAWMPTQCEVYPMPLRSRLPAIHVPLRPQDSDAQLDLQAIVDLAYRKGRYRSSLNYADPPDPPLPGPDAKWARANIREFKKKT